MNSEPYCHENTSHPHPSGGCLPHSLPPTGFQVRGHPCRHHIRSRFSPGKQRAGNVHIPAATRHQPNLHPEGTPPHTGLLGLASPSRDRRHCGGKRDGIRPWAKSCPCQPAKGYATTHRTVPAQGDGLPGHQVLKSGHTFSGYLHRSHRSPGCQPSRPDLRPAPLRQDRHSGANQPWRCPCLLR